jgi:D-glycero-D-manno-heptose 1,7-bisphosphate phosphatase
LGRGLFTLDDLEAMHHRLCEMVESAGGHVSGIFYCPHTPDDQCDCRKPKHGLIDAIEREFNTSARGAWIIGDSQRDLEAGMNKGCVPVLVRTGKGKRTEEKFAADTAESARWHDVKIFDDLAAAASALIATTKS